MDGPTTGDRGRGSAGEPISLLSRLLFYLSDTSLSLFLQLRSKELDLQVDLSTLRKQKAELSGTPPPSTTTPVAQPSPATNTTIKAPMQAEPNTVAASESPAPVVAAVASTAAAPPAEEGLGEVEMQDGDEAVEY